MQIRLQIRNVASGFSSIPQSHLGDLRTSFRPQSSSLFLSSTRVPSFGLPSLAASFGIFGALTFIAKPKNPFVYVLGSVALHAALFYLVSKVKITASPLVSPATSSTVFMDLISRPATSALGSLDAGLSYYNDTGTDASSDQNSGDVQGDALQDARSDAALRGSTDAARRMRRASSRASHAMDAGPRDTVVIRNINSSHSTDASSTDSSFVDLGDVMQDVSPQDAPAEEGGLNSGVQERNIEPGLVEPNLARPYELLDESTELPRDAELNIGDATDDVSGDAAARDASPEAGLPDAGVDVNPSRDAQADASADASLDDVSETDDSYLNPTQRGPIHHASYSELLTLAQQAVIFPTRLNRQLPYFVMESEAHDFHIPVDRLERAENQFKDLLIDSIEGAANQQEEVMRRIARVVSSLFVDGRIARYFDREARMTSVLNHEGGSCEAAQTLLILSILIHSGIELPRNMEWGIQHFGRDHIQAVLVDHSTPIPLIRVLATGKIQKNPITHLPEVSAPVYRPAYVNWAWLNAQPGMQDFVQAYPDRSLLISDAIIRNRSENNSTSSNTNLPNNGGGGGEGPSNDILTGSAPEPSTDSSSPQVRGGGRQRGDGGVIGDSGSVGDGGASTGEEEQRSNSQLRFADNPYRASNAPNPERDNLDMPQFEGLTPPGQDSEESWALSWAHSHSSVLLRSLGVTYIFRDLRIEQTYRSLLLPPASGSRGTPTEGRQARTLRLRIAAQSLERMLRSPDLESYRQVLRNPESATLGFLDLPTNGGLVSSFLNIIEMLHSQAPQSLEFRAERSRYREWIQANPARFVTQLQSNSNSARLQRFTEHASQLGADTFRNQSTLNYLMRHTRINPASRSLVYTPERNERRVDVSLAARPNQTSQNAQSAIPATQAEQRRYFLSSERGEWDLSVFDRALEVAPQLNLDLPRSLRPENPRNAQFRSSYSLSQEPLSIHVNQAARTALFRPAYVTPELFSELINWNQIVSEDLPLLVQAMPQLYPTLMRSYEQRVRAIHQRIQTESRRPTEEEWTEMGLLRNRAARLDLFRYMAEGPAASPDELRVPGSLAQERQRLWTTAHRRYENIPSRFIHFSNAYEQTIDQALERIQRNIGRDNGTITPELLRFLRTLLEYEYYVYQHRGEGQEDFTAGPNLPFYGRTDIPEN